MKKILRVNLFFLVLILLQLFGGNLLLPIKEVLHISQISQLLFLTQLLFLIAPVTIYILVTKQSFVKVLRIKKLSFASIGYIIIISILTIPIVAFLGAVTNLFFHNNVNDLMLQMKSLPLWQMVAVVALLPACCEELTMRGVVLSGFKEMPLAKAAVLSGFLFAVLHLNPPQFLYAFALGIIFAYLVNITESIFSSMIVHFIINGNSAVLAWFLLKVNVKGNDITSMPKNSVISVLVIYLLISIMCTYGVYTFIKKLKQLKEDKTEKLENEAYCEVSQGESKNSVLEYSPVILSGLLYIMYVFKVRLGYVQSFIVLGFILLYIIYCLFKIRTADEG